MQDFLDYFYEHTRTIYIPFGKINGFGDEDVKRVSWIDGRDVAHAISTLLTTNNISNQLSMLNNGSVILNMCGRESLTIDDIAKLFAKKMNQQPVNVVALAHDQFCRRMNDMYGESEQDSQLQCEIFESCYESGALKHIDLTWCKQLRIAPRTFEEFIEREAVAFQGKKQTVCLIGSIQFVQRHLLKLLHLKHYRARHVICSAQDRETDDSVTHYLAFDFERQKKMRSRQESNSDRFKFNVNQFKKTVETEVDLNVEFVETTVKEGLVGCDFLILLLSPKYIHQGWLSFETVKSIIKMCENSKVLRIILGYDLSTLDTCGPFIVKVEQLLTESQIPFSKCQWNWTFQQFGVLTGSEIQCRSTLSIPRPKNTEGPSLSWVDAHDVALALVNTCSHQSKFEYSFLSGPTSLSLSEISQIVS
jgi:hypothetical protein